MVNVRKKSVTNLLVISGILISIAFTYFLSLYLCLKSKVLMQTSVSSSYTITPSEYLPNLRTER